MKLYALLDYTFKDTGEMYPMKSEKGIPSQTITILEELGYGIIEVSEDTAFDAEPFLADIFENEDGLI